GHAATLRERLRRRDRPLVRVEDRVAYQLRADDGGADAIKPQFGVGLLSLGIVDAADDTWHMERVLGDLRRQNVAIVTVRDGDEAIHLRDSGATQHNLIGPIADHVRSGKVTSQAYKRGAAD